MSKKLSVLLLIRIGLAATDSEAAETPPPSLTPENAVVVALAENRDLTAARFAILQAEARLKQSGLWPNPEFELRDNRGLGGGGEYEFSTGLKQRFPITSRLAQAKAVARVDVAMALAEVRNQERLLAGEVLSRSRAWLVTEEKLQANEEIQNVLRKLIEVSETRLKVAEVSAADVNLAKLELQKVMLAQAALIGQQESASAALNRLLGREPRTRSQISGTVTAEVDTNTAAAISQQALARRPDRQLAALRIDRAGAEIKLARAEKWEDWTIGFDYSRSVGQFNAPIGTKTDNFFGVGISIPLPFWNKNQGKIGEAQATQRRAEAELAALNLRIVAETQAAEDQMRRLLGVLRQYREGSIKLAEENIALLQRGYRDGLVNITTVIQAQQQLTELRQGYLETLGEFVRAKTEWETATGLALPAK